MLKSWVWAAWVGVSLGVLGCPSDDDAVVVVVAPPPERPRTVAPQADEALFDTRGDLLESDRRIGGLPVPRGIRSVSERGRSHEFMTKVPFAVVLRYFGPRLMTGTVDRQGEAVTYREAVPRGAASGGATVDVAIRPLIGGETYINILEHPEPPLRPIPPEEIEAHVRELQKHAS